MKHGVNTDGGHDGNETWDEGFSLFGDRIALPSAQQDDRPSVSGRCSIRGYRLLPAEFCQVERMD